MNKEQRKHKRVNLIYYLEIYDNNSEKHLGYLVDITPEGLMMISEEEVQAGTEYQLVKALKEATTTPISVLWWTARGSRFREPIKTCRRSNTNDLACRLALEDPASPFFSSRSFLLSFLFISYSSTPFRNRSSRYLA